MTGYVALRIALNSLSAIVEFAQLFDYKRFSPGLAG